MRRSAAFAAAFCSPPARRPSRPKAPEPSSRYTFWRPAPVEGATEPSEVIAHSAAADWRAIAPDNLLVMDLADGGRVVIELAPDFAPVHVANVRAFARGGWWNGATIYRVQDNYVAQWGNGDAEVRAARPASSARRRPNMIAPLEASPSGRSAFPTAMRRWPAMSTAGRSPGIRSGPGLADPLLRLGRRRPRPRARHRHRRRALCGDRPCAAPSRPQHRHVGRVIEGIGLLSARPRGTGNLGFYETEPARRRSRSARVRLASDMPEAERPQFEVMRTESDGLSAYVTGRANRGGTFFNLPAGGVDLCNVNVPVPAPADCALAQDHPVAADLDAADPRQEALAEQRHRQIRRRPRRAPRCASSGPIAIRSIVTGITSISPPAPIAARALRRRRQCRPRWASRGSARRCWRRYRPGSGCGRR